MRIFSALIFSFLLAAAAPVSARAGSSEPSIKADVDQAFITIGDRVHFHLTVSHSPETNVILIDSDTALRDFEIKNVTNFSHQEGGQVHEGKNYVITNYELGEYVIHPIVIQLKDKTGKVTSLKTNSLYVTVRSIDDKKNTTGDIRGLKDVLAFKGPVWPWFLSAIALLTTGGFFLWRILRDKVIPAKSSATTLLTAHDEAYQALHQLKHSDYLSKGQYKLYFLIMSEILRRYFERRFQIHALESTTLELMSDLKDKVPDEEKHLIQEVLDLCDMVKFAKYTPSVPEVLKQNKQSLEVIDRTKETASEAPVPNGVNRPNKPMAITQKGST